MVTLTYGHGKLYDFESVTGWTETELGSVGSFATDGDVVTITIASIGGTNTYYIANDDEHHIDVHSDIYTKILGRYKTSSSSIKAEVQLVFDDASTQTVLAETSSTTWKTFTTTITATKTIDHIRLHADQATGTVEYDFILIHQATFTFPTNQPETMTFEPCPPRLAFLDVPGRSGDIDQGLATHSGMYTLYCNLDVGTWKRAANPVDTINGEVFIQIAHQSKTDPWQWFDNEYEQLKVKLVSCQFTRRGNEHYVMVTLKEYRLGSAYAETWYDRYGLKL